MTDFIYIVKVSDDEGNKLIKLGYSSNCLKRMGQYLGGNPLTKILYIAEIDNAQKLETIFHSQNKVEIGNEWYNIELLPKMLELLNKYDPKRLYIESLTNKIDKVSKSFRIEINNNLTELIVGIDNDHNKDFIPNTTFKSVVLGFQNNKFTEKEKMFYEEKYPYLMAVIEKLGYVELKNIEYNTGIVKSILEINKYNSTQFKEVMKEYISLIDCKNTKNCICSDERIEYLENLNPEIKDLSQSLGTSKIRTLGFNKKKIKIFHTEESEDIQNKVKQELTKYFKIDTVYASSYVKDILQTIYNKYKINRKAKATDLAKYYKMDKKSRYINGVKTDSIIIN